MGLEESNATRVSVAGDSLTEPNLYFANGKMQTDPDSTPPKSPPLGGHFYWHGHLEGGI